jgi:3-hydroxyisobutyrate dehydrogenase-like beta-hydroxyacid dehydrogenase
MLVGLVGLGRMGAAIAQRLAEQGLAVIAWDRSDKATAAAAARGVRIAANARAIAAGADIALSIVSEDHGVRQVFAGPEGFLSADVAGKLFVEMSTLQPMTGRELGALVAAKGARFVESPVLGTIPSARAGKLFALAGGEPADVELARAVLDHLARRVVHMGPHGAGYAMKLAVNLGLGAYVAALAESLALGACHGLTLAQMLDVLKEAPTAAPWLAAKAPALMGEPSDVTLTVRLMRKDLTSALATGALSGLAMPLTAGALASYSAAVAGGAGDGDLAALATFLREGMVQDFG